MNPPGPPLVLDLVVVAGRPEDRDTYEGMGQDTINDLRELGLADSGKSTRACDVLHPMKYEYALQSFLLQRGCCGVAGWAQLG